jgi:hypothetical protein
MSHHTYHVNCFCRPCVWVCEWDCVPAPLAPVGKRLHSHTRQAAACLLHQAHYIYVSVCCDIHCPLCIWETGGHTHHSIAVKFRSDRSEWLTTVWILWYGHCPLFDSWLCMLGCHIDQPWGDLVVSMLAQYSKWRMVSSGMLHRVPLVRTDVSEELSASFITVTRIGELGTTLAVTSNRRISSQHVWVASYI